MKESPPEPFLTLELDGQEIQRFTLDRPRTSIGRARDTEIQIAVRGVSRFHAAVLHDGRGNCRLKDLGSANGTFVNGERISGDRVLEVGDVINFLDYSLRFGRRGAEDFHAGITDSDNSVIGRAFGRADAITTEATNAVFSAEIAPEDAGGDRFEIEVRDGDLGNTTRVLDRPLTTIGGEAGADVRLSAPGLERLHALLVVIEEKLLFVRISPVNIVRVNGTARMVTFLEAGDEITFGKSTIVVRRC